MSLNLVQHVYDTVYPKKYAHGFCFAVLCCGYTLTDFPISIRLTSLALWQSNDCPSASKATLMDMDKYFMWIHYERLHNHNKAKHNKTVCIFLGIYCTYILVNIAAKNAFAAALLTININDFHIWKSTLYPQQWHEHCCAFHQIWPCRLRVHLLTQLPAPSSALSRTEMAICAAVP